MPQAIYTGLLQRYFAFLRAVNVGGHTVKMDVLRQIFESLGYMAVETYIASGNVIFESACTDVPALEEEITVKLYQELGYEVAAFLRTGEELAAIASYRPFSLEELDTAEAYNVAFLTCVLDDSATHRLMDKRTGIDSFQVRGREVYWLCRRKQSESTFSNAVLEKVVGRKSTLRGVNTIYNLAEKYALSVV
jgi:uncharacterized protein (DUF1697 family)